MNRAVGAVRASAFPLAVAGAAFGLAVGMRAGDTDMWWHLASGRWMVEHRDGMRVDVFSSTATGEPYALGDWLGQVVLYLTYAAGGWNGLALLRAALVATAAFAVTRLALRSAPVHVAVPLALFAVLLSKLLWVDRPQLFTLALLPVVLELCLAARGGSRAALFATVPVVALWANLHTGYALGLAALWIFVLEAVIERRPVAAPLAAAFITSILVNLEPGALSPLRALGHVAGPTIRFAEDPPIDPLTPFGMLFAVFLGATLLALLLRGAPLLAAMAIVPMLVLALSAQRHVPLFAFVAVPFVAGPLASLVEAVWTTWNRVRSARSLNALVGRGAAGAAGDPRAVDVFRHRPDDIGHASGDMRHASGDIRHRIDDRTHTSHETSGEARQGPSASATQRPSGRPSRSLRLPLAVAVWLGAVASIPFADPRPELRPYPVAALGALRGSSGILLNEYDWGGYLIWAAPERPVFVDSRLYPFAGNGVIRSYEQAIHVLPAWRAVVERWSVSQALVRPDRPLVQALLDEGWTVRAQDTGFVLLERPR